MEEIRLIEPTMEYADDIMVFRKEMLAAKDEDVVEENMFKSWRYKL